MKTALTTLVLAFFFSGGKFGFAVEPTNDEQYMIELINRARAIGNTEAARLGLTSVNAGNPSITGVPWTIPVTSPPVTWNEQLAAAARGQAQLLFNQGWLGQTDPHTHEGTSPESRAAAAGYSLLTQPTVNGVRPGIENFSFAGSSVAYTPAQLTAATLDLHNQLFIDSNTTGRLHRITIMNSWFREIGLGMVSGTIGGQGRIYFMMDYGKAAPGSQLFLTGVVYNDNITANSFYTPGEGLGGLKVQAFQNNTKVAETTTYASGGYKLPLAAGGYTIRVANAAGNVSIMGAVSLTSENVKLDSRSPAFTTPPIPTQVNLQLRRSGNSIIFTWDDPSYSLAASTTLAGLWTVVASSSPATIAIQPGKRFFRCQK